MGMRSIVAALLCLAALLAGQASVAPKPYDVNDAYQIYSLLLPQLESYGFAKGTVIIQEETWPEPVDEQPCVTTDAAKRFKEAIADYHRINKETWLLKPEFQVAKYYELVSEDTLRPLTKGPRWDDFYKRYPNSGGYVALSAVGFNNQKSRAIVFAGSGCGGLCGRWQFYLLEKIDGKWKVVPGISCMIVS